MTEPPGSPTPTERAVDYKGAPLDSERGPGLGCFRFQLAVLVVLIVLTPLSVAWNWPAAVSAALLFAVILLLFLSGQTIIFLLRLVAADRRAAGRRRPLASTTKTVGELEDEARGDHGHADEGHADEGHADHGQADEGQTDETHADEAEGHADASDLR